MSWRGARRPAPPSRGPMQPFRARGSRCRSLHAGARVAILGVADAGLLHPAPVGRSDLAAAARGRDAERYRGVAPPARLRPADARAVSRLSCAPRRASTSATRWCSAFRSSTIIGSRLPYTLALAGGALSSRSASALPIGIAHGGAGAARALERVLMALRPDRPEHADLLERHPADPALRRDARLAAVRPASDGVRSVILPSIALGALTHGDFRAHRAHRRARGARPRTTFAAARAKGRRPGGVLIRHIAAQRLDPRSSPISALEIANLLAGAVIVETVFAWPGLGQLAVQSIPPRDFLDRAGHRAAQLLRLRSRSTSRPTFSTASSIRASGWSRRMSGAASVDTGAPRRRIALWRAAPVGVPRAVRLRADPRAR